jgi:hypothetical protein
MVDRMAGHDDKPRAMPQPTFELVHNCRGRAIAAASATAEHARSAARRRKVFLARLRLSLVNIDLFAEIDFLAGRLLNGLARLSQARSSPAATEN